MKSAKTIKVRNNKFHKYLKMGLRIALGISTIGSFIDRTFSPVEQKKNKPFIQKYSSIIGKDLVFFNNQTLKKSNYFDKSTNQKVKSINLSQVTDCPYSYSKIKIMEATAYYPGVECTGKYAQKGLTYTGKKAGFGLVAVDPSVISLGTNLFIEGYGKAEAADIGGAIRGSKIDLCFATYQEAKKYGRKKIKVYILK